MKKVIKIISIFLIVGLIVGTLGMFAKLTDNFKNNNKTSIEKNWKDLIKKKDNSAEKNEEKKVENNKENKKNEEIKEEIKFKPEFYYQINKNLGNLIIGQNIEESIYKLINSKNVYNISTHEITTSPAGRENIRNYYSLDNLCSNKDGLYKDNYKFYVFLDSKLNNYNPIGIIENKINGNKYLMIYTGKFNEYYSKYLLIKIDGIINFSSYKYQEFDFKFTEYKSDLNFVDNFEKFWNFLSLELKVYY